MEQSQQATSSTMDVTMQKDEQQQSIESTGGDGSTQDSGARGRARFFIKKQLTALERKKYEKMRKVRQLRKLRKILMPKNAIVALHELQGPGMAEFTINTNGQETRAELVVNNVRYEATAANKNLAKAQASEKALRDLVFARMARVKQQRSSAPAATGAAAAGDNADGANGTAGNGDAGAATNPEPMDCIESEDLPMEHLAAFALHKLFVQWEAEGFEVPFLKPCRVKAPAPAATQASPTPNSTAAPAEEPTGAIMPKVTKTVADLPPNAAMRHPTALFAYMRPQIAYQDLGSNNDQTNLEFYAGLRSDGKYFKGTGRSKKLARKAAAVDACRALFGVEFDESVLRA